MIEVENVSKLFGNFRAVDGISFSIQTGEIVGLLGPNGAGKTTTMRMISGFLEPDSGTVKIDGLDVLKNPVETKRKIGYMPESAPMYSDMIVADYLKYIAEIENQNPAEKCRELAEVCGLKEVMHKNIGELSRGNRQRVGLAHALMGNPEILILDEPTSGLDPNQVLEVRSLIKQIGQTKKTIENLNLIKAPITELANVFGGKGGKLIFGRPPAEESAARTYPHKFGCGLTDALHEGISEFRTGFAEIQRLELSGGSVKYSESLFKPHPKPSFRIVQETPHAPL